MLHLPAVGWVQTLRTALGVSALAANAWAQPTAPTAPTDNPPSAEVAQPKPAAAAELAPNSEVAQPSAPASAPAAAAETDSPREEPPPTIELRTPPPAPPIPRTFHTHDGLYLRLSAGLGALSATVNNPSPQSNLDGSGNTIELDLMAGGSPSAGMALGGALLLSSAASTDYEGAGKKREADTQSFVVGPFIDGYPKARGGFHLGGAIGLAGVRTGSKDVTGLDKATGVGFAAWTGYDAWVGDEWSVGGLVRLIATRTKGDTADGSSSLGTTSLALMFTALYH